jgi:NADPH-dependent glutamate synthase beta subunit-like oxidoreductase
MSTSVHTESEAYIQRIRNASQDALSAFASAQQRRATRPDVRKENGTKNGHTLHANGNSAHERSQTPSLERMADNDTRFIAVIGAAVSGVEAAQQFAEAGYQVVVIETQSSIGGKVIYGLPFWHAGQAITELVKMGAALSHPNIHFVPHVTAIPDDEKPTGRQLTIQQLQDMGFERVIVAAGAPRDRALTINDQPIANDLVQAGRVKYQNDFIAELNHRWYSGDSLTEYPLFPEGTLLHGKVLVIGGGLASLSCSVR